MQLETFTYKKDSGWSVKSFPQLDSKNTLILVFCAPEMVEEKKVFAELKQAYPQSKIIGCSTAGEIDGGSIYDKSLSVAVLKLDKSRFSVVSEKIETKDSFKVGADLVKKFTDKDLKGIFILSDGLSVNGSELVKGLNSLNNSDVVITGGLAGDGDRFKKTWIIEDGEPVTGKIIGVGFYGKDLVIGHGSKGGWDPFGPERHITKSRNNILFELDNKPALELYKKYLGEKAKELPASGLLFPLVIRQDTGDEKIIVRTILSVDEKNQSLTFAGDVPEGYLARLMRANFDRLVGGANEAAVRANEVTKSSPCLGIAISCVGRRLLMGERTEEETESTFEALAKGSKQVGFYSYGEISPYATGECDFHNQTMTFTTIQERN